MKPVDPVRAVLNVARWLTWVTESAGPNRGEAVDAIIRVTGLDPAHPPAGLSNIPWCACLVAACGYAVHREQWPLKKVAGCVSLYDDAKAKGMIRTGPAPGRIFLLWSDKAGRFNHTGFVWEPAAGDLWRTVEGNTNPGGSPEGTGVFIRQRTFGPKDRFIEWLHEEPKD